jgi:hypothetical protein
MKEIWKDIEGYEGYYSISNYGNVKSLERIIKSKNGVIRKRKEMLLKPNIDKDGYYTITLTKNSNPKTFKIHRLVGTAFIDNPNNFPMINHKDENKQNNYFENLEWCDSKYNNNYGTIRERMSKSHIGIGKGKKLSDATRTKMSEAHKKILGRPVSIETRKKLSDSLKRYYCQRRSI